MNGAAFVLLTATLVATAVSEVGENGPLSGSTLALFLLALAVGKGVVVAEIFMGLRWVAWRWRMLLWAWVVGVVTVSGVLILA
ncbi:hypothetical protein JCM16106_12580 [Hydrogenophilus islandicus]